MMSCRLSAMLRKYTIGSVNPGCICHISVGGGVDRSVAVTNHGIMPPSDKIDPRKLHSGLH